MKVKFTLDRFEIQASHFHNSSSIQNLRFHPHFIFITMAIMNRLNTIKILTKNAVNDVLKVGRLIINDDKLTFSPSLLTIAADIYLPVHKGQESREQSEMRTTTR